MQRKISEKVIQEMNKNKNMKETSWLSLLPAKVDLQNMQGITACREKINKPRRPFAQVGKGIYIEIDSKSIFN